MIFAFQGHTNVFLLLHNLVHHLREKSFKHCNYEVINLVPCSYNFFTSLYEIMNTK